MEQKQISLRLNEEWDIVNKLEDGQFGKVFKAMHKTKGLLASVVKVHLHEEDNPDLLDKEFKYISKLDHENIATIFNFYDQDGFVWICIEYLSECSLKYAMTILNRPLSEIQITFICKSLCKALAYIHSFNLTHCGIKSNSLVLSPEGRLVLTGLEVSTLNKITLTKKGTFTGSPHWLAPELILSESFVESRTNEKSDIWSSGITLIELAQMFPPYHKMSHLKVMQKIRKSDPPKLKYPSKFSESFSNFIAKCLIKDPTIRPSAKDILSDPFLDCTLNENPLNSLYYEVCMREHNENPLKELYYDAITIRKENNSLELPPIDNENENLQIKNRPRKTSQVLITLQGNG